VDRVLPRAPYRQWVLTLPPDLARAVAYDSELCGKVFGIFAEEVQRWYCERGRAAGIASPRAGMVLEIQRFADGARLWPHSHGLTPDGVFWRREDGRVMFRRVGRPKPADVQAIVDRVERRVARLLCRRQQLAEEQGEPEPGEGRQLLIRCGDVRPLRREAYPWAARAARKAGVPKRTTSRSRLRARTAAGFELDANVRVAARDRAGLERLCRYIGRGPLPLDRISLQPDGSVSFELRRTWKNGVHKLVFDPLSFVARVAALVPPAGWNQRRYYGVFAPNHKLRADIVPKPPEPGKAKPDRPIAPPRPGRMSWADLMKRVFQIDVLQCPECQDGRLRIIAAISEPTVVELLLAELIATERFEWPRDPRSTRGPPDNDVLYVPDPQ